MNFEIQAPEKAVYKFNEVTSLTGVKPYVLRFWETEFNQIQPQVNEQGQKIYSPEDLEVVQKIKKLLFEEKMSIPEARALMDKQESGEEEFVEAQQKEAVEQAPSIQSRSEDLKMALEQIIEKNSRPLTDQEERKAFEDRAKDVADKVKTDIQAQTHLADKDIINLVTAKKKLTVLLGKIDSICEQRNW